MDIYTQNLTLCLICLICTVSLAVESSQQDELFRAVGQDNVLAIVGILKKSPVLRESINAAGDTPLWVSIKEEHLQSASVLLVDGAETYRKPNKFSVLHGAIRAKRMQSIALLLAFGMDPGAKTELNESPIEYAIKLHQVEAVKLMVANIITKGRRIDSDLLEVAIREGADDIVLVLLSAEASPSNYNQFALNPTAELELFLVNHPQFDINSSSDVSGLTPLHYAAMGGKKDTVDLLINRGAKYNFGRLGSPLHWAAKNGRSQLIEPLLKLGLNVDEISKWYGVTPLIWAVEHGNSETVRSLLNSGADPENKGRGEETPLELAVANGKFDSIKAIVDYAHKSSRR